MKRREFLGLAALPLAQALNRQPLGALRGRVIDVDGADAAGVDLVRDWTGPFCRSRVTNRTKRAVRIRDVTLFDLELTMPAETALYGEGFQMLTQTGGTLALPVDFSQLHRCEALPHSRSRRRARVLWPADADAPGTGHDDLRVHLVRPFQWKVPPDRGRFRRTARQTCPRERRRERSADLQACSCGVPVSRGH